VKAPHFSERHNENIASLTATNLVAHALASGEVDSVRQLLRQKGLEKPLETAFQKMQIIQRSVRGSEAEKDNLLPRFFALRLWSGCSSLFFTLNPHDIKSPLTISLLQNDMQFEKQFSLDWGDAETEAYIATVLKDNPRRLHEAVASNPLAATRCFHWTVKLVLRTLFNCDASPGRAVDSIAARETPGIFGHVRAYMGVVEPQMRKALHIHALVQLWGFSHPTDIFRDDLLADVFRRVWYFVASISFRSTEAFAHYLDVPSAMEALQEEPLLHLTKKQRGMIGEERARETMRAQLKARGLCALPTQTSHPSPMSYVTSTSHGDATVTAQQWGAQAVKSVCASTRKTGNHVCRPDVCHKGSIGKKGFCRMMFWHWACAVDKAGERVAKRTHGLAFQERWDGVGHPPSSNTPPSTGAPAVEIVHPFHFKMTPGIMLGPTCNHDLGVLLRLGQQADSSRPLPARDAESAISSMLDAMGDHEFYCASYSSKDQPHVEGLLMSLSDALRAKEKDIVVAKAAGEDISAHEIVRKSLHTLVAATNRRMHKGFPEMLSYLLQKPMEYCSHQFVGLTFDHLLRLAIAHINSWVNDKSTFDAMPRDESHMKIPLHPRLHERDYPFRPTALEEFPLYFF